MIPISPDEMRAVDANCTYFGLLPIQLMENAGSALASEARRRARGKKIAVVAGRGNNGGDALVPRGTSPTSRCLFFPTSACQGKIAPDRPA